MFDVAFSSPKRVCSRSSYTSMTVCTGTEVHVYIDDGVRSRVRYMPQRILQARFPSDREHLSHAFAKRHTYSTRLLQGVVRFDSYHSSPSAIALVLAYSLLVYQRLSWPLRCYTLPLPMALVLALNHGARGCVGWWLLPVSKCYGVRELVFSLPMYQRPSWPSRCYFRASAGK